MYGYSKHLSIGRNVAANVVEAWVDVSVLVPSEATAEGIKNVSEGTAKYALAAAVIAGSLGTATPIVSTVLISGGLVTSAGVQVPVGMAQIITASEGDDGLVGIPATPSEMYGFAIGQLFYDGKYAKQSQSFFGLVENALLYDELAPYNAYSYLLTGFSNAKYIQDGLPDINLPAEDSGSAATEKKK